MATSGHPLILLVEDDEALRVTTRLVLERRGFEVETAVDGVDALDRLSVIRPDVAVVDVMMPRMDGMTFVRRVRERFDFGVVMLTARDLPYDELAGFDAGADDYIVKPFDGDVLAAHITAVIRRLRPAAAPGRAGDMTERTPSAPDVVEIGDLKVDRRGMTVTRSGDDVLLSGMEFRLLLTFCDHPGRVLSREQLLDLVWGSGSWGDPHVVEVTVGRLRNKIGAHHLVTVRGLGYKLVAG